MTNVLHDLVLLDRGRISLHPATGLHGTLQHFAAVDHLAGNASAIGYPRCYRTALPGEVLYHQRRNAFRAALKLVNLVNVQVAGEKLKAPLQGKLLDVSATGCKLRFEGDIGECMQLGQVYERFTAGLPFGSMTTPVELRYLHFEEHLNITFAGMRFHNISGGVQRQVERFVYQLQREARQFDKDDY